MPPIRLAIIAWIPLAAAFLSAAAIVHDIYGRGTRQHVRVMEGVWPITALYLGPLGLLAYARSGRPRLVSAPIIREERRTRVRMRAYELRWFSSLGCWL